ncbi:MAG: TlpA family protein disulfide reductase [Candidatus Heimdallarchaeaceae archaeon]
MKRIFTITVILTLILPMFVGITNVENVSAAPNSSAFGEKSSLEEISVGSPSIDFNITDVDSGITYNLTQFLGQVVFLDLWATWCGPCEISLPYIEHFYKMYPEEVFQIISIDIDNSETDGQVSSFRKSHDMDWIVGIDYDQSINSAYGTGFIPTFYIIDPTGIVRWSYVGINEETFYDEIYAVISEYVDDDATDPVVEFLEVTNNTEFSIFDSEVHVTANFSDNWNLLEAQVKAEFGDNDEVFELILSEKDGFYTTSLSFELDSLKLYGRSSVDIHVSATDYFGNSITEKVTLNLTEYIDTTDPVIGDYSYNITQVDDKKFNVMVQVEVTEDLYVAEAYIELYKGVALKKTANLEFINATHMEGTAFSLYYVDGDPTDYTIKIVITDAAGNSAEVDVVIGDAPGDTSFGSVIVFISAIFAIGLAFRKRKR